MATAERPTSTQRGKHWKRELEEVLRLIPGYDAFGTAGDAKLDHDAAQRAIEFFPDCIRHVEGELAGQPFELEPWEKAITGNLFGWKRPDGTRRYREAYCQLSRGNGKSAWGAGTCLYALVGLNEYGAQIYCAAGTREQAGYVFRPAKAMVQAESLFTVNGVRVTHNAILWEARNSFIKAMAGDADTSHGGNTLLALVDELHIVDWDFWRTIRTSTGKRRSPLIICTTTAGWDKTSVCFQRYTYACKIRDGIVNDPSFLPVVYETKDDDDWKSEATWRKANPNFGISVMADYITERCAEAVELPSEENTFRQLHLGQWTEQAVRWLPMEKWDACSRTFTEADLGGQACYAGLDLGAVSDLTALALLFPQDDGTYRLLSYYWCPKEAARKRTQRDRVQYDDWIRAGLIRETPGDTTDYDRVRLDIRELSKRFVIKKIAVDRLFQGADLCSRLVEEYSPDVVEAFGQGFYGMASPTRTLEEWVIDKKIHHDGNPVTRWMFSNAAVEMDSIGNKKPSKKHSSEKIDIVVATCMTAGLATAQQETGEIYIGSVSTGVRTRDRF
jgi:phage terminase large subunit-like protein